MPKPTTIQILLSTYNGEKYLTQQLNSLIAQDYPNFTIIIRDDGSTDFTLEILNAYKDKYSNISITFGDNIGVTSSYFELIKNAQANFYALCDQDDIWLPSKLSHAVANLTNSNYSSSSLYCSALQFVNSDLIPIGLTPPPRYQCLENAVIENIATGCTIVFGESLRQLFIQATPQQMHMHDWWLYLLASSFGNVIYDPKSFVLYRRHDATVTGLQLKSSRTLFARLKGFLGFLKNDRQLYGLNQAVCFRKTYGSLLNSKQQTLFHQLSRLHESNNLWDRLNFAIKNPVLFNDKLDNYAIRLLVILGKH